MSDAKRPGPGPGALASRKGNVRRGGRDLRDVLSGRDRHRRGQGSGVRRRDQARPRAITATLATSALAESTAGLLEKRVTSRAHMPR